jgi:hypothetical protein
MNNEGDRVFNHALYHLVTHWAAMVTILVLLLTVGVVLLTTTGPMQCWKKVCACVVIGITAAMPIYFLTRMVRYGKVVNAQLPADYVSRMETVPQSPRIFYLAMVIVGVVAATDMILVIVRQ